MVYCVCEVPLLCICCTHLGTEMPHLPQLHMIVKVKSTPLSVNQVDRSGSVSSGKKIGSAFRSLLTVKREGVWRGRKEENKKGETEGLQQVAKEKEGGGEEWKKEPL